jgi:hypothetical protein
MQELTEEETPDVTPGQLGLIEMSFTRVCLQGTSPFEPSNDIKCDKQPGAINEKTKKDAMLGAITK